VLPKPVEVISNEALAIGIHRIELGIHVEATPGQFVMLWLPGVDEKPFAVAGCDPLAVVVAEVGPASRKLCATRKGDVLGVRGPFGKGFSLVGQRPLLVGGGYGAAALLPLAGLAVSQGLEVKVALGARNSLRLVLAEDFARLGCRVEVATDDGSAGFAGPVTELAKTVLVAEGADSLYACGPEAMLLALAFLAKGRLPSQLSVERYIKCAVGICGQCTLGGQLVCRDGPVFSGDDLLSNPEFGKVRRDACGARGSLVSEMAGTRK
jgi:dihydroorotate dehydrogenase electron transfer subunit